MILYLLLLAHQTHGKINDSRNII